MVCGAIVQYGFIVLTAVEDAQDGHRFVTHLKSDNSPFFVIGHAQTWANVIAFCSSVRECRKTFAA